MSARQIGKAIADLDKVTKFISKNSLPVLKEIRKTRNSFSSQLVSLFEGVDHSYFTEWMQMDMTKITKNVDNIANELDEFDRIIHNPDNLIDSNCDFLASVWCGDYYDGEYTEHSALRELTKELLEQALPLRGDYYDYVVASLDE